MKLSFENHTSGLISLNTKEQGSSSWEKELFCLIGASSRSVKVASECRAVFDTVAVCRQTPAQYRAQWLRLSVLLWLCPGGVT